MKPHDAHNGAGDTGTARDVYAASCRLWPDPFLAPDVPPQSVLAQYRKNPASLPPGLSDQIAGSMQCRRALAQMTQVPEDLWPDGSSGGSPLPTAVLNDILRNAGTAGQHIRATGTEKVTHKSRITPGQLWSTRGDVEFFSDDGVSTRYTFQPPFVIIVSKPVNMPGDDTICRAVAVSPGELWPMDMIGEDEVRLGLQDGSRWVAHLWLNFPVSTDQLSHSFGKLDAANHGRLVVGLKAYSEGLPLTPSEGGGLPFDSEMDTDTLLERDQLLERCSWLAATADARRAFHETMVKRMDAAIPLPEQPKGTIIEFPGLDSRLDLCAPRMRAAADDATSRRCRVILWNGDLHALPTRTADKPAWTSKPTDRELHARLVSGIHEAEGRVSAQWELVGDRAGINNGALFFLVEGDTNKVIGGGLLGASGRIATLKEGDWTRLQRHVHDPSGLILLIRSIRA